MEIYSLDRIIKLPDFADFLKVYESKIFQENIDFINQDRLIDDFIYRLDRHNFKNEFIEEQTNHFKNKLSGYTNPTIEKNYHFFDAGKRCYKRGDSENYRILVNFYWVLEGINYENISLCELIENYNSFMKGFSETALYRFLLDEQEYYLKNKKFRCLVEENEAKEEGDKNQIMAIVIYYTENDFLPSRNKWFKEFREKNGFSHRLQLTYNKIVKKEVRIPKLKKYESQISENLKKYPEALRLFESELNQSKLNNDKIK
jgi:hypothetical protein